MAGRKNPAGAGFWVGFLYCYCVMGRFVMNRSLQMMSRLGLSLLRKPLYPLKQGLYHERRSGKQNPIEVIFISAKALNGKKMTSNATVITAFICFVITTRFLIVYLFFVCFILSPFILMKGSLPFDQIFIVVSFVCATEHTLFLAE